MTPATPRGRMSAKRRHHIFTENSTGHNIAPCCICGNPIHRHDDRWIIEHKRALGLLGTDTNPNCAPAHENCGLVKTNQHDMPMIRKARRQSLTLPKREREAKQPTIRRAGFRKTIKAPRPTTKPPLPWRQLFMEASAHA